MLLRLLSIAQRPLLAAAAIIAAEIPAATAATAARLPSRDELRALAPAEVERRMVALRAEVGRHDALYHREAAPEISDLEYDQLKRRLTELEQAFPEIAGSLPRPPPLGDDRSGRLPTHRHREPMLSLAKAGTAADVRAFHQRLARQLGRDGLTYVVEPKVDGVALSVTYERGQLVRALTRGNGREGDDVTENARHIRGLPSALAPAAPDGRANPLPEFVELRGEIHVPLAAFARINRERGLAGEPIFANPRNLAAGTLRQQDAAEVAGRGLEVVFFGMGACEPARARPATQRALQAQLAAWGLPAVEAFGTASDPEELIRVLATFGRARAVLNFASDGAVVKLDALALQREVGADEEAPRWALAYKFAPERSATQVRAITLQVGRTGVLTPVAELTPVELSGSTVARATLHNREEIARKDIRVGDTVYLEKAGEIIPAVVGVDHARRPPGTPPFAFPTHCPQCEAAVVQRPGEAATRCPNLSCPARSRRRIEHFASRAAVNIRGLGPATIDALMESGAVRDPSDLYRLRRADLLAAGKSTGATAEQLLANIEASKRAELWRFIRGLGIPRVGAVASREAARRYGSLEGLTSTRSDGDAIDRALATYLADPRHRSTVEKLIAAGVRPGQANPVAAEEPLAGQVFVLTGTLPTLTRAQAVEKIEAAGGRVTSRVSKATNYVVAGDAPGAKREQALILGVAIIDEAKLRRLLGRPGGSAITN